jgi:hypothetical protein
MLAFFSHSPESYDRWGAQVCLLSAMLRHHAYYAKRRSLVAGGNCSHIHSAIAQPCAPRRSQILAISGSSATCAASLSQRYESAFTSSVTLFPMTCFRRSSLDGIGMLADVPASYGAYRFNKDLVLSSNSPFGLAAKADDVNWAGRFNGQSSKMFTVNRRPGKPFWRLRCEQGRDVGSEFPRVVRSLAIVHSHHHFQRNHGL